MWGSEVNEPPLWFTAKKTEAWRAELPFSGITMGFCQTYSLRADWGEPREPPKAVSVVRFSDDGCVHEGKGLFIIQLPVMECSWEGEGRPLC